MIRRFPERAIRLVLGFSPGSASDFISRALAPEWTRCLGQPVVVEFRPGANGAIGAALVARSAPDGYTLFMATLGSHALAPHFSNGLPYDPIEDFSPVSLVACSPLVLAVHPSVQADSVEQLIALAESKPAVLAFASSAVGGAPHLAGELFQFMAGIEMAHVCYDRTEQLYADLAAGRVALSFNNVMSMAPRLKEGVLRGLAVTGAARSPVIPELPTVAASGLPGYEVTNWLGIVAPAQTPSEVIGVLQEGIVSALRSGGVAPILAKAGVEASGASPVEFAQHIQRELTRWAPVVAKFRHDSGA